MLYIKQCASFRRVQCNVRKTQSNKVWRTSEMDRSWRKSVCKGCTPCHGHSLYFHVYLYLYCVFIFIYICVCTACHGPSLYFHTERIFMCICVCTCIRLYWTGAKEGLQGEPSRKLLYQDHFALLLSVFLSYICLFAGLLDCWWG